MCLVRDGYSVFLELLCATFCIVSVCVVNLPHMHVDIAGAVAVEVKERWIRHYIYNYVLVGRVVSWFKFVDLRARKEVNNRPCLTRRCAFLCRMCTVLHYCIL